jgi:two-component system cell cycle response regulator DivK
MGRTVMLVEDNELLIRMYDTVLKSLGCSTVRAQTVEAAMQMAAANAPDLVIMDINLPDGSGIEATRRLRSTEAMRDVPIIAVTTRAGVADEAAMREAGATAFMTKPIKIDDFAAAVRRHLG